MRPPRHSRIGTKDTINTASLDEMYLPSVPANHNAIDSIYVLLD